MIWILMVALVDAYGRNASKRYEFNAIDFATAQLAATDFLTDLGVITELRILSYTLSLKTAYTDTFDAGANKDEGLTVVVRKADNDKAIIKVPGPLNALFNADGTLDLTDSTFLAFIANFLSGVFMVSDGEIVDEVVSGRLDK